MARITQLTSEAAVGEAKELLDTVKNKLGLVPNMARAMANSPAVLQGYLSLNDALRKGGLSAQVREQIALAVSEANGCDYCVAAHSTVGKMLGLTPEQIRDSREGTAVDSKTDALIHFARRVLETRGRVDDSDLGHVRDVGFDDAIIAEVVANVALHVFTNYFNNVAETDLDFPRAPALKVAAVTTA